MQSDKQCWISLDLGQLVCEHFLYLCQHFGDQLRLYKLLLAASIANNPLGLTLTFKTYLILFKHNLDIRLCFHKH